MNELERLANRLLGEDRQDPSENFSDSTIVDSTSTVILTSEESSLTSDEVDSLVSEVLNNEGIPVEEDLSGDSQLQEALDSILIPVNSGAISMRDSTARFSGATWFESIQRSDITVAGLGGIGSWVSLVLSRMFPNSIHLYDNDTVETVNMSGQLYGLQEVGIAKVQATANIVKNFSNYFSCILHPERYTISTQPTKIMFCGFDNMIARRDAFSSWRNGVHNSPDPENWLFVDGRLAAEEFQVFAITGEDQGGVSTYYNKYLFRDSEGEETTCSFKQTSHVAMMIASQMVNVFTNFMANKLEESFPRPVPFLTTYDAETMYYNTKTTWREINQ